MQSQCVYWLKRADAPSPTNNYAFHVSMAIKLKKNTKKTEKPERIQKQESEEHDGEGRMNEVKILQYRNSWLVFFFFVSLFLSRCRRSPSPRLNKRAVWPIPSTADERG